jgi:hypothetical protein
MNKYSATSALRSPAGEANYCFKQSVPLAAGARETRSFTRQDHPNATVADAGQQSFEAWSHDPVSGATEIIVNHFYITPSQLTPTFNELVLTPLALDIVRNLMRRRLTDIHDSIASQMLRRNLIICHRRPHDRGVCCRLRWRTLLL